MKLIENLDDPASFEQDTGAVLLRQLDYGIEPCDEPGVCSPHPTW